MNLDLLREEYFEAHQRNNRAAHYEQTRQQARRDSGLAALHNSKAWKLQTRPNVLRRDPLCKIGVLCGGRAPSTDVDHITRADIYIAQHGGDENYFFDESNLQGMCHADHTRKTAMENAGTWVAVGK